FIRLFWFAWQSNRLILTAFLLVCATGMMFESLLERQVGISFFCIFLYLLVDSGGKNVENEIFTPPEVPDSV
ncbi:MAG: hypothetical protein AAF206_19870, partial [Bacteroidota bacterium]